MTEPVIIRMQKTGDNTYTFVDQWGKPISDKNLETDIQAQKEVIEKKAKEEAERQKKLAEEREAKRENWNDKEILTILETCARANTKNKTFQEIKTQNSIDGNREVVFGGSIVIVPIVKNTDDSYSFMDGVNKMNREYLIRFINDKIATGNPPASK